MTTTIEKRRSRGWSAMLLIAAGLLGALLLTLLIPRVAPWSPPSFDCDASIITMVDADGNYVTPVHFFTLDGNGVDDGAGDDESVPKEVLAAFGVNANMGTVQATLDELCRRMTQDPSLVAGVSAAFGLVENTGQATTAAELKMLDDREYWADLVRQIEAQIDGMASIGTDTVDAGSASLYMVPSNNGPYIELHRGTTTFEGTVMVFTRTDGSVVKLRLDCGFQPVFDGPPDYPDCVDECDNPPCPPGNEIPGCSPKLPENDRVIPWTSILGPGQQTDGQESERQHADGDVSGNVTDNQVGGDTQADDTTTDTGDDVIVGDSEDTNENIGDDVQEDGVTNDDDGGTEGDGQIATPEDE